MVDCAIILENIEKKYKDLHKYMKSKGFDIWINNLLFKLLMSLFIENTHKSIYLPIIDCLILFGDIILHRACLLLFGLIKDDIMKCKNLNDAAELFDIKLKNFVYEKFVSGILKNDFGLNMNIIMRQREEKLPKIWENIKKIRKTSKTKKDGESHCDLDWPYCIKNINEPIINNAMKFKVSERILIEDNYFILNHNVYKLAQDSNENMEKALKNSNDINKKKSLIYGNLLIERSSHKCGSHYNSREKILGPQSQRKSSLMNVFFEQNGKKDPFINSRTSSSEELIEMVHNKSDFMNNMDKSFLIESVIEPPKEEEKTDQNNPINIKEENKIEDIKEEREK